MSVAIDPCDVDWVEATVLPSGRYAGAALHEVGRSLDGLKYLDTIITTSTPPKWIGPNLRLMIARFLARPDKLVVLRCDYKAKK